MGDDTLETKPFLESRENDALGKEDPGALAGSSSENLGNEHLDDADGPQSRPETKSKSFSRRKASPWWLLPIVTITALLYAATIAPRTELLVKLACNELHPDWDLASNATTGQHNTTADSSSRITRRLPVLLQFVHRSASNKRSNIDIPGTNIMCSDDVDVQKAVAKLNTAISTTSGILSVLTTGWWTQLSDRVGRVRILTIGALSGTMVDVIFVLVVRNSERFPGGYHLLVLSNMIDGLFGGFSTAIATSHAYVSDCVPSTERSRWFSLWSGIIFGGMAFGPSLGSLVSDYTKNIMVIFYIMVVFDLIYTVFVGFVLPESMSEESLRRASESKKSARQGTGSVWWKEMIGKLLKVIAPLAMFFPRVVSRSGTRKRYDWNPAFIGLAYALHATNSGSYSFKYQYAIKAFAWSSTQMGNWLSLLGFTRALHLVVILPLILKGIHRYRGRTASVQGSSNTDADSKAKSVDLLVARASLAVDVSSYTASALVTTSDAFVGTTALLSFGGGYPPAIQSLALALTQNSTSESRSNVNPSTDDPRYEGASIDSSASDDTGRLLGAMSVVYALCSQIIGPSLFGMTFVATIASLPRAIFWLSAALNFAALSSLLLVRLAPANQNKEDDAEYVLLNNMEE